MEHSANSKEDNADEMKSVDFRPDRKDPIPNLGSDPDPQAASTAPPNPRHGEGDNAAGTNANGMDLKEKKKNDSSPGGTLKPKKSVRWCEDLVTEKEIPRYDDQDHDHDRGSSNHYVNYSPAPPADSSSFNFKETMGTVKDVIGKWGRKVGEATKKAEDFAESTWQHLKTNPSLTEAALGRIAQGTKVLAEGGYEKIFRQTFETVPEEQLKNEFACYLSTSAGPVMGVLYVSTAKLAFCSDNPLSYHVNDKTDWSYYKAVIPLHQLQAVNPSASRNNPAEKYIQVISIDNHEFWFMGFLNYNGAAESLRQALSV